MFALSLGLLAVLYYEQESSLLGCLFSKGVYKDVGQRLLNWLLTYHPYSSPGVSFQSSDTYYLSHISDVVMNSSACPLAFPSSSAYHL